MTLQFILMVNGAEYRDSVLECLRGLSEGIIANSCRIQNNHVEVWDNSSHDPQKSGDPVQGYLYFAHRVEVTPLVAVTEKSQVILAKQLISVLRKSGWQIVPCANFENQL